MPVFTRMREGVLEMIVDGDFTPGEVQRAGSRALESDEIPKPVPLLLDMSGAAGLQNKSHEDLQQTGSFLGSVAESLGRVALLAPPTAALQLEDMIEAAGLEARPFGARADAVSWLTG